LNKLDKHHKRKSEYGSSGPDSNSDKEKPSKEKGEHKSTFEKRAFEDVLNPRERVLKEKEKRIKNEREKIEKALQQIRYIYQYLSLFV
jgi:hypothetical protein